MITNVPTSDDLNRSALRHHFSAWVQLLSIATDFDEVFFNTEGDPDPIDWSPEREEYLKGSQADLQTCCTLIQQSNELALKARIAEVSPYLLLFRNDKKLAQQPEQIDFSDLRTLDASDLPRAVNAFCERTLSDPFVEDYEFIRKLRNRIVHIGSADRDFDPEDLLKLLVRQYIMLWPDRGWLSERYRHAKDSRFAVFHDGKYSSAEAEVFGELSATFARLTKSQFEKLLGAKKSARRYICPPCIYNSSAPNAGVPEAECSTAFLMPDGHTVRCAMCEMVFSVTREKCEAEDCKGNVISSAVGYEKKCLTCGDYNGGTSISP